MRNPCVKLALIWPPSSVERINYCISAKCKNDIMNSWYRVWRGLLNGRKVSKRRFCTAFRTRDKAITPNLPSSFVIFHARCIWNYIYEIAQCTFWEIHSSFLPIPNWFQKAALRRTFPMPGEKYWIVHALRKVRHSCDDTWHNKYKCDRSGKYLPI